MTVLIKNANVYAPENLGRQDILIAGEKILRLDRNIEPGGVAACLPDMEILDARGSVVLPGLIDPHVHLIGGGGEMGFATRTPEVSLEKIIEAGVTTAVGLLGTDGIARSVEPLLAKAKGLETEGITTYIYTGSYTTPSVTITGSVARDIMFIDKIIGVKMALSDHRSSHFTFDELVRLASDARVAGMLSGKPGIVHIHMGEGKGRLDMIMKAAAETDIPVTQFMPTHVTRTRELFEQAKEFAKLGGHIDITSFGELTAADKIKPSRAISECIKDGVPAANITVSSDGNGSVPQYDSAGNIIGIGIGSLDASLMVLKNLVQQEKLDIGQAIPFFTAHVAKVLGIYPRKGCIRQDSDADLLVMDRDLKLQVVLAKGRKMMDQGRVIAKGTFAR
ncbi:beta-aspartyl-peptidase [Acetonema longum]|uniref:Isoaspartyl dipeptidase n=1 Tax=Acetonema longum DSM 6540 TaxID=1009370 RepID=F7NG58_9FIRM|nr:beta-aspartyl-peptidase [Acetonema longum]EGO64976.1 isoaspartyl dipeptidase [Acetonema longum DSM 6540]